MMEWRTIKEYPFYELSDEGFIRKKNGNNRYFVPQWRGTVCYYVSKSIKNYKKQTLTLHRIYQETFPDKEKPKFTQKWFDDVIIRIGKHNIALGYSPKRSGQKIKHEHKVQYLPPKRKCNTCGRPTDDYRCKKCWSKILRGEEPSQPYL